MKCPKCNYVSHDYLDTCRKCSTDLSVFKQRIGLFVLQPGLLDLSVVLGNRTDDDPFAHRFEEADAGAGVNDFDISLDDYAERPVMRRAPGTFIRPGMQQDAGNLQHLTLQLDASAMSTEMPRNIVRSPAESPRSPASQAPPPLPPSNPPAGDTDLPGGHLTIDLDDGDGPMRLVSGLFPQPPPEGEPRPPQSTGGDRRRRQDRRTTEASSADSNTLEQDNPPPGTSGGSTRALGVLAANAMPAAERGSDVAIPLLDSTTDDPGGLQLRGSRALQETIDQSHEGKQAREQDAVPLPTMELFLGDTFDAAPSVMEPAERNSRMSRREPSTDSLDPSVVDQGVTEDAFDIVERLERPDSSRPGPGDMLPSGMIPRAGLGTTRSMQPAPEANTSPHPGNTLDALTADDFAEEDLAFEFQGSATNRDGDAGLIDDANPFQFDLHEIDLDTEPGNRNQGAQHESMPGRLTLELDAGAMSMELSSTTMDNPITPSMSATERRTVELRLDTEATTDSPLAGADFTSLADTAELDHTPKTAQSGHLTLELDINAINAQLPPGARRPDTVGNRQLDVSSAPDLPGKQSPDDDEELLLDLDDLDDNPRPS